MRCPSCGQRLADEARKCPVCGTVIDDTVRMSASGDDMEEKKEPVFRYSETEYSGEQENYYTQETLAAHQKPAHPAMPMKWYKFLIYFSLILTGLSNMYTGVQAVMGMQYETKDQAAQVYAAYPGLHILDIVYGILLVVLGVFALIVRQQLAAYRAKGPKYLLIMYIASLVLMLFYIGVGSILSGVNLMAAESGMQLITSILVSLFMIGANKVYFDKRAHLFTR